MDPTPPLDNTDNAYLSTQLHQINTFTVLQWLLLTTPPPKVHLLSLNDQTKLFLPVRATYFSICALYITLYCNILSFFLRLRLRWIDSWWCMVLVWVGCRCQWQVRWLTRTRPRWLCCIGWKVCHHQNLTGCNLSFLLLWLTSDMIILFSKHDLCDICDLSNKCPLSNVCVR